MNDKKTGFTFSVVLLLVLAGLVCFLFVFWKGASKEKRINVEGNATVYAVPDEANISFGVKAKGKTPVLAKDANDKIIADVTVLLKKFEITEDNLSIERVSVRPYYSKGNHDSVVEGFDVIKDIGIKIKDLSKYNRFIDELLKIGIEDIYHVRLGVSDLRKYKDEARIKALAAAREKAELLAKNADTSVLRVLLISENNEPGYLRNYISQNAVLMNDPAGGGEDSLFEEELGRIPVNASLSVSYEIN